jgi:hypothetical protein
LNSEAALLKKDIQQSMNNFSSEDLTTLDNFTLFKAIPITLLNFIISMICNHTTEQQMKQFLQIKYACTKNPWGLQIISKWDICDLFLRSSFSKLGNISLYNNFSTSAWLWNYSLSKKLKKMYFMPCQ